ncbi:MAG: molybdopterin cofactor-binding domain-containing protein [Paracoccaceae bacterium]
MVALKSDGRAGIKTGMADIGAGTCAMLTRITAEMLGLAPERVEVRRGDTDSPPAAGSNGVMGRGLQRLLRLPHLRGDRQAHRRAHLLRGKGADTEGRTRHPGE